MKTQNTKTIPNLQRDIGYVHYKTPATSTAVSLLNNGWTNNEQGQFNQ